MASRKYGQPRQREGSNPLNALDMEGDETPDVSGFSRGAAQTRREQRKPKQDKPFSKDRVVAEGRQALDVMATGSVFYVLADLFVAQPWVHTYRGDTEPLPTLRVAAGPKLIARLLSDRVRADERFTGWDTKQISETVEYAMKHFFVQVPNDERGSHVLVNRFLHEDWWQPLISDAIDHFKMLRTPMPDWVESQQQVNAFYAAWPKKQTSNRPKTVKEAAARFNEIYAKYLADQAAEDALLDEEPLT